MQNSTHFCENCGSPLEEGASFCEACGAPVKAAGEIPPAPPAPSAGRPASPPPVSPQNQAVRRPAPPPPPPGYYQPPVPPPPAYYQPPVYLPPVPPRRKTSTGLIVGGVILGLVVCCGLVVLVASLVGGAGLWNQITGSGQIPQPAIVVQDTAAPAEPVTQATDVPVVVVRPTLTSQPAPNQVQATPVLPVPQGDILEFTDDLLTNDNQWSVDAWDSGPRKGFYPSAYYLITNLQHGEYRAWIPKIDNDQYKVRDFEIEFYGLAWDGDGYLGLDFHWVDDQNYYQAVIKDGKFLIRKKVNGQFTNLTRGWVASNSILSGPNKIAVVMHGDVMQLKVNDDLMAQLKDDSLPQGDVVLTAGVLPDAPDGTTFEGRFNNFHVLWYVQP
jgi:hypothetical protein